MLRLRRLIFIPWIEGLPISLYLQNDVLFKIDQITMIKWFLKAMNDQLE